jgi:hypothetical protein
MSVNLDSVPWACQPDESQENLVTSLELLTRSPECSTQRMELLPSGSEGLVVMLGAANAGSGSSDTMVGAADSAPGKV